MPVLRIAAAGGMPIMLSWRLILGGRSMRGMPRHATRHLAEGTLPRDRLELLERNEAVAICVEGLDGIGDAEIEKASDRSGEKCDFVIKGGERTGRARKAPADAGGVLLGACGLRLRV